MALDHVTGTFTAPAVAGQVTVVLPFEPKYVKFWLGDATTLDAFAVNATFGYGWAVSTASQHCVANKADDGVTTNNSAAMIRNDSCVLAVTDGKPPSINLQANLFENFAVTAGGFKLDFTSTVAGVQIHYAAYGGTDITNVSTVEFSQGAATGNVSFTGAGFAPDFVEFLWNGKDTAFNAGNGKGIGVGAAISATKRWAISALFKAQNAKAGKAGGHGSSTHCILSSKGPASVESQSDFVSLDADGGTVNVLTAKNNFVVAVLCIKGSVDFGVDIGVDTAPTTASVKDTTTTIDPDTLFMVSMNDPTPSAGVTDVKLSMGASDGTNHASFWSGNVDNPSPSTTADQYASDTKALVMATPGTPTKDAECTAALGTLKFSLDWTLAGPANEFVWIAMKGAAGGGAGALIQAAPSMSLGIAAALTTAITLGASASLSTAASAALTTAIPVAAAPSMSLTAASSLQTAIDVAAAPDLALAVSVALTAPAAPALLAAAPSMSLSAAPVLTTSIEMAASAALALNAAANLQTAIQMAATPDLSLASNVALTAPAAAAQLAAAPSMSLSAVPALTTNIEIAASPALSLTAASTLQTAIRIAASPQLSLVAAGDLLTAIELAASPSNVLTANGNLATAIDIATTANMSLASAANLVVGAGLRASPDMSLSAASALTTAIELSATPLLSLDAASALTIAIELSAVPALNLDAASTLSTAIEMAAAPVLNIGAASALATAIELSSSPLLSMDAASALNTSIEMAASGSLTIDVAASLTTQTEILLEASPALNLDANADLLTAIEMAATPVLSVNAVGNLLTGIELAASPGLSVSTTANLVVQLPRVFCAPYVLDKATMTYSSDRDTIHTADLQIGIQESEKCK